MKSIFIILVLTLASKVYAQEDAEAHLHPTGPAGCGEMEYWDYSNGMCMPFAMAGMPMRMLMVHHNSFLTQSSGEGPRGRNALSLPNMFMVDAGSSLGDRHYVNLEFMGTLERWTFPERGYPELLQIGEANHEGEPYLDAQHPHSSPIMGLTLSDTITLGNGKDHFKFWFAPRGQATEGPVAFMHRPTGMVNPDAPLGHHIGQDVGHIASTVVGAEVRLGGSNLEVSTFNGTEPEPSEVDLPIGKPNSYAARFTQAFNSHLYAMISTAFIQDPEPHHPDPDHLWRYSGSVYYDHALTNGWEMHNAFIYGLVNFYDHTPALNSFAEEFWLRKENKNIWGRIEHLQRTAGELDLATPSNDPRWVTAVTLGYTHQVARCEFREWGLGFSVTKDFLPRAFERDYAGDPVSAKVFLRFGGMQMWEL